VHSLLSLQLSCDPPWQLPLTQVSLTVHWLPSLHDVPLALACVQPVAATQESVVQTLPSSQLGGEPGWQDVPEHVSAPLHAFPSEHDVPGATAGYWHWPVAEHVSWVQGLVSPHATQLPPPLPQAERAEPPAHDEPVQQPVQQLLL